MTDRVYGESFLQTLVAIHFGEGETTAGKGEAFGKFVSGDYCCFNAFIHAFIEEETEKIELTDLGALDFTASGVTFGSSARVIDGTPVLLLVGDRFGSGDIGQSGIIMASEDGISWSRVLTLPNIADHTAGHMRIQSDASIIAVVWNSKFYAAGHISNWYDDGGPGTYEEVDILFGSDDGWSWSELDRRTYTQKAGVGTFPPTRGLLVDYCSDRVLDSEGNGVPDGFYHYSVQDGKTVFIRTDDFPTDVDYAYGNVSRGSDSTSITIEVTENGETTTKSSSPPMERVYAVAYANNIIVAVGSTTSYATNGYAVSFDMGDTWTAGTYPGVPPPLTVSGV